MPSTASDRYVQADPETGSAPRSLSLPEESAECLGDFRQKWIPGLNWVFNSFADVLGDWYYLYSVFASMGGGVDDLAGLDNLDLLIPLLLVTVVSTLMFFLVAVTYCAKAGNPEREVCCVDAFKRIMLKCCCRKDMITSNFLSLMEDIFEDVPTIALTALIDFRRRGEITPAGMLNITTSAFNLVYNILSMLMPRNKGEERMV